MPTSAVPAPGSDRAADLTARSRELRQAAGVAFDRMAAEAAISKSHLSQLERGLAAPGRRARTWLAILEVLDRTTPHKSQLSRACRPHAPHWSRPGGACTLLAWWQVTNLHRICTARAVTGRHRAARPGTADGLWPARTCTRGDRATRRSHASASYPWS